MAIFCSFAINVSMNEMSSSSTEFNIVPGDSMFAAALKRKKKYFIEVQSHISKYIKIKNSI